MIVVYTGASLLRQEQNYPDAQCSDIDIIGKNR